MDTLNSVKMGKLIGAGLTSYVFLGTAGKNKYAIKYHHIFEGDKTKNLYNTVWRDIECAQTMHKVAPKHFLKLYDYKIIDNCKLKQSISEKRHTIKRLTPSELEYINKLYNTPYCMKKLYTYVEYTLESYIMKNLAQMGGKQLFALSIQILYAIYLLNNHGYYHADLHEKNIGINKTKDKTINILGHKIPTFGLSVIILDYDNCLNKKFLLSNKEKYEIETKNDLFSFIQTLIIPIFYHENNISFIDYADISINGTNKIQMKVSDEQLNEINKFLPIDENNREDNKKLLQVIIYSILYYKEYQKNILHYYKIKKPIIIDNAYFIDKNLILQIIKNIYNIKYSLELLLNKFLSI